MAGKTILDTGRYGARVAVDAAHLVVRQLVDMSALDVDYVAVMK